MRGDVCFYASRISDLAKKVESIDIEQAAPCDHDCFDLDGQEIEYDEDDDDQLDDDDDLPFLEDQHTIPQGSRFSPLATPLSQPSAANLTVTPRLIVQRKAPESVGEPEHIESIERSPAKKQGMLSCSSLVGGEMSISLAGMVACDSQEALAAIRVNDMYATVSDPPKDVLSLRSAQVSRWAEKQHEHALKYSKGTSATQKGHDFIMFCDKVSKHAKMLQLQYVLLTIQLGNGNIPNPFLTDAESIALANVCKLVVEKMNGDPKTLARMYIDIELVSQLLEHHVDVKSHPILAQRLQGLRNSTPLAKISAILTELHVAYGTSLSAGANDLYAKIVPSQEVLDAHWFWHASYRGNYGCCWAIRGPICHHEFVQAAQLH